VGGTLENRPRYHNSRCFDAFAFPAATEAQQQAIRDLAEQLDAHRKRVLAAHQNLTLTGLYNVLEKLRSGEALTTKELDIHERGLVSVMKHLHDQIDAAVFDAYRWPRDLSDEEILARLVELNKERRAEEARGIVRWLRPEYQAPAAKKIVVDEQGKLDIEIVPSAAEAGARRASWPKTLPERVTTIRGLLAEQPRPAHLEELARRFQRAPRDDVQEVLNALVALGLARRLDDNRYAP
jgi:predicted transcriptional regulator